MSRYIDADVLIDDLIHNRSFYPAIVSSAIKNTPTADVVEVVRCKDCKFWHNEGYDPLLNHYCGSCHCKYWAYPPEYFETHDNDYCCYGERSENGT